MNRKTLVETGLTTAGSRSLATAWSCRVESGSASGLELAIGSQPLLIGADVACDIVLDDPTVSRRHAEIRSVADGIQVTDLGSTNGTFYRSSRLTEVVLTCEDTLEVGRTSVRISPRRRATVSPSKRRRFGSLVGHSLAMREIFAVLELASPSTANLLIEGESGTGKELVAQAVHDHSPRAAGPLVVVDCSAAEENLLNSQLFGHRKGSFTGAIAERKGAFAQADGGTLFLDEIGELPASCQKKLLRAVEAGTIQPLGADRPIQVDARVLAATHRDLTAMVEEKTFRFDLFQRLAVVHLKLPPLRQRLEDLPVLIEHFYQGRSLAAGDITGPNLNALRRHGWPGNVRELRNVLERAWVLDHQGRGRFADLELWLQPVATAEPSLTFDPRSPFKEAKQQWLEAFERRYLAAVVTDGGNNLSEAARRTGINRNHLRKLLQKHGLYSE